MVTREEEGSMEGDEKDASEVQETEQRDEVEDLDVSQQKAEDVSGGAIGRIEPRYPGAGG